MTWIVTINFHQINEELKRQHLSWGPWLLGIRLCIKFLNWKPESRLCRFKTLHSVTWKTELPRHKLHGRWFHSSWLFTSRKLMFSEKMLPTKHQLLFLEPQSIFSYSLLLVNGVKIIKWPSEERSFVVESSVILIMSESNC